jgi:5-formaminoimidazole-4-carboxamide-1-(beta)-D-ribofuranosyl 5'-monophosphate synthetase
MVKRKKRAKKTHKKQKAKKSTSKKNKGIFDKFLKGVKIEVSKVKGEKKEIKEISDLKPTDSKEKVNLFEKFGETTEKILKPSSSTKISKILESYDNANITIGVLGGHSALDVCRGAKKHGLRTVAVCQKGREQTYAKYYKTREDKGIIDEIILVDKFKDIVKKEVQNQLRELNTIFIHNRYFWVYCDFKDIEKKFKVPIFGTRTMLKLEERDVPKNQYYLLQKAGIRIPKIFKNPKDINKLVIVKVAEAARGYERAFFFCNNYESYKKKSEEMLKNKTITKDALKKAVIEEYIVGAQVNFNYFYSPLTNELEVMGTDTRRQTNLDGLLRLPADTQLEALKYLKPKLVETGHIAVTTKESILEKIFKIGEQFVETCKKEHPPGIIGPFALQGAVAAEQGKEELVIFDVSMRIPGSPGTMFTPYSGYLHHDSISYGERIAMEIKKAIEEDKLDLICT